MANKKIPVNAIAETIYGLEQDNLSYKSLIEKNKELIKQLEPLAEWEELPKEQPAQQTD
jgi:hypothetical protein